MPPMPPGRLARPVVSMVLTDPPPPEPSMMRMIGRRRSAAIRSAMIGFSLMVASALPPRTVKSSPTTTTGRPSTRPRPMTQLEGVNSASLPSGPYFALPAIAPTSWKVPGSSRAPTRSRTVSRPPSCWRLTLSGPPIASAMAWRRARSSSSGCQLIRSAPYSRGRWSSRGGRGRTPLCSHSSMRWRGAVAGPIFAPTAEEDPNARPHHGRPRSLHRRLGPYPLRPLRGAGHRDAAGPGRPRRHRGCRHLPRRHRCRLRRRLRRGLHQPGLPELADPAVGAGAALQADHPLRECLRHRHCRDPRRARLPRREARPLRAGARRREDDRDARRPGRRDPAQRQLPQDRAGHPGRLRRRLRPHRRGLFPAPRRPVRRARRHRREESQERRRQPLGADAQGPRLRLLPRREREEPLRRPAAEAHRLFAWSATAPPR